MGWKEKAAVMRKFTGLRREARVERDGRLKVLEAERKAAHSALEVNHKRVVGIAHAAYEEEMASLADRERDEIEGAQD